MIVIKEFRKSNNLTQADLAKMLGVSRGFIAQVECGASKLPEEHLKFLLAQTNLDTSSLANDKEVAKSDVNVPSNKESMIPLIPFEAHAGTLSDYCESATLAQCEMFMSPIKGATCAIRITGDSMMPKYEPGSIAVLKKINEAAFLEYGKVYVLDTVNGAVIKTIQKAEKENAIECVSINPKYPPFTIDASYINGWYRVIGVWSFE